MRYLFSFFLLCYWHVAATHYSFTNNPIDVVIPCHAKDLPILEICIEGVRKNGENIGKIYVISKTRLTENAEWVDESLFPFTPKMVTRRVFGDGFSIIMNKYFQKRGGWIYQQLLKLYAFQVIPSLSDNTLILDADTVFLNSVSFLSSEGNPLMNYREKEKDVFSNYIKKFLPEMKDESPVSGITHHMVFQKPVLEDLFSVIENHYKVTFWQAFCDCCRFSLPLKSNRDLYPTEYGIYFNFLSSHSDQMQLRQLKYDNIGDLNQISEYQENGYHYVSIHSYLREKKK